MNNEELSDDAVQHEPNEKDPIKITNGTFRYIITNKLNKVKRDLRRLPGFDPITFTFSENSNSRQESLLEV